MNFDTLESVSFIAIECVNGGREACRQKGPKAKAPVANLWPYGATRSASDATSRLYTTTEVFRGLSVTAAGSDGSCVTEYVLGLASVLVKVSPSVTVNR